MHHPICIMILTFVKPHRKLGDHTYLSWNNAPASKPGASTAMASGREVRPNDS